MKDYDDDETFYEEDEPADKIVAAFDRGPTGVTAEANYSVIQVAQTFGTPSVLGTFPPIGMTIDATATKLANTAA